MNCDRYPTSVHCILGRTMANHNLDTLITVAEKKKTLKNTLL